MQCSTVPASELVICQDTTVGWLGKRYATENSSQDPTADPEARARVQALWIRQGTSR